MNSLPNDIIMRTFGLLPLGTVYSVITRVCCRWYIFRGFNLEKVVIELNVHCFSRIADIAGVTYFRVMDSFRVAVLDVDSLEGVESTAPVAVIGDFMVSLGLFLH